MENNIKATVIIPVYNTAPFLRRCLDSVLGQTCREIEVITVDDGSADESGKILDEYAARDGRVKVIHQPNSGQAAARNRAIDIARGEWISFVDSDDKCETDMLETLIKSAEAAGANICWGGHILHYVSRGTACLRVPKDGVFYGKNLLELYYREPNGPAYICAAVFRKECFDGLRFPEGRIYEDMWIMPHIIDRADRAVCIGKSVYHYYLLKTGTINGSTVKKQMDMLWAQEENTAYAREHHSEWEGYANRKLLEVCADLLGRIDRAGRRQYREYWERVCARFNETRRHIEGAGIQHKCVILLFRINPVLCAKCCRLYSFMNFRFRISGARREKDG